MKRFERGSGISFYSIFALTLTLMISGVVFAQSNRSKNAGSVWRPIVESDIANRAPRHFTPDNYGVFRVNLPALKGQFAAAPLENTQEARNAKLIIEVPMPDGSTSRYYVEESPLLSPEVAAMYPHIKTYQGYGVDDRTATARFDVTATGFHGFLLTTKGTIYIDPYQVNDTTNYIVFEKQSVDRGERKYHCEVEEAIERAGQGTKEDFGFPIEHNQDLSGAPDFSHGTQLRTYRTAIGTTFEYTNIFRQTGDTNEQASQRAYDRVVISVNRISAVFRKEFAATLQLVSTTATTYAVNPESPADYSNTGSPDLNANVTNLNAAYTTTGYDLGHVFGSSDNGVAQLSSVCGSSKARGYSGQPNPQGDPFDVDYVAHEMGHQFGANHTFNSPNNCGSSPANARREPGAGVTIMSYVGICSSTANPQRNAIDTYHIYNTQEILNFLAGAGGSCGTLSGSNNVPVVQPLQNYTIPYNTPFALTASATDADNDPLTYYWEQSDPGASAASYPGTTDDDDASLVFRPGFRSYLPVTSPTRYFPSMTYILNNNNEAPITYSGVSAVGQQCHVAGCITGEDLPSAARTMNFRVSVRDGVGGIADQGTALTVVNTSAPFAVTAPNTNVSWTGGSNQTVTWNVVGTNTAPISAANVRITLSTDGGTTFPTVLAASAPNSGSAVVTIPNTPTANARIKVEAVGNIFFDVSNANFTITPGSTVSSELLAGRITNAAGQGIANITVRLTGGTSTVIAITNAFGYYSFGPQPLGTAYTITPEPGKRVTSFSPASLSYSHASGASVPTITGN